jgi:hypothetical protein
MEVLDYSSDLQTNTPIKQSFIKRPLLQAAQSGFLLPEHHVQCGNMPGEKGSPELFWEWSAT